MAGMLLLWLIQMRTRSAGVVDVGWAAVLGSLAVLYAVLGDGWLPRRSLLAVCGCLWGYRLALHLLRDRVLGKPIEGRYVALRQRWAAHINVASLFIYQAQAIAASALSLPFLFIAFNPEPSWMIFDAIGLLLLMIGIVGEYVADRQLNHWKSDPDNRDKTCQSGIWRYSRHPNYFFEWIIGCGFAVLAIGTPQGWIALIAPLSILYLILRVTGIPPAEAQALRSRGNDHRRYQQATSLFFAWAPRKETRS
jgi:steroid 5-alpha reductase family enzyme